MPVLELFSPWGILLLIQPTWSISIWIYPPTPGFQSPPGLQPSFATRFPRLRQSSIRFRLNQSHNPWIWFKPAANKEDVISKDSKGISLNTNFDANWDVFWSRKHMFHCCVSWCANGANRLSPCCLSSWYAHPTYTSYNILYSSWETKGAPPMPTPQEIRPY